MTKDQVNQTVGATPYDPMAKIGKSPGYGTPEFDAWMKQDQANRENDVDYKFTIAGINNWKLHFDGPGGGLSTISGVKSPGQVQDLLPLFTDKFGKPQLKQFKSRSNSGLELDDFTATWMLKDTVITLNKYFGQIDKGFVSITSKDAYNRKVERMKQNQDKAARDFE